MSILHQNNTNEVASGQVLDVLVGEPPRHMLMFTGIAQSKFRSDSADYPPDKTQVVIMLGRFATHDPGDGEWSATVGLSSIANGDSDFIFATDSLNLDRDPNGELRLTVDLAANGTPSVLNSFSYQVTLLLTEPEVDLTELLVGPDTPDGGLDRQTIIESGNTWRYQVVVSGPAPGPPGIPVIIVQSARPDVAPVSDDPSVPIRAVVIQPGSTTSDVITAPATAQVNADTVVVITASYKGVTKAATVTVRMPGH